MKYLMIVFVASVSVKAAIQDRFPAEQIINGTDAKEGEFPWQLSIRSYGGHQCAAVLIRDDRALTAAHCVKGYDAEELTVLYDTIDVNAGRIIPVASLYWHEQYGNSHNDIAILRFNRSLTGANTQPIALPAPGQDFSGQRCVVTGWGQACGGGVICVPQILQRRDVTVLTDAQCSAQVSYYNSTSHICIDGGDGSSTCNGDSGGPCNCGNTLAGITISGSDSCLDGPGVQTRVVTQLDWINKHID